MNTGPNLSPINTSQMKSIIGQLYAMEFYYARVFVYRFDLQVRHYPEDNLIISSFWKLLTQSLKATFQLKRLGYIWTREQGSSPYPHYHCALFVDGSKVRSTYTLNKQINSIWIDLGNAHVQQCGYKMLKRNDTKKKANIIYWLSYLAKTRGKGSKPQQTKNYGNSRLRIEKKQ